MGKLITDAVFDVMLTYIADNCKRITVCSTQPTTYTEGNATYALADITTTEGLAGGDFSLANGDVSGRKLVVAQQPNVTVDTSGSAQHVALLDVDNTALLAVTTCTTQSLTAANTVTIPTFDIELQDAA